jgi:hypothetical protein
MAVWFGICKVRRLLGSRFARFAVCKFAVCKFAVCKFAVCQVRHLLGSWQRDLIVPT